MSPDLNTLSTQRVCSISVSAYGVCGSCLSLEVLCVNSEEKSLVKLFEPIFCRKLKNAIVIGINAFVSNAL